MIEASKDAPFHKKLLHAATNKITITITVVDLRYIGEELILSNPLMGECCLLTAIWVIPLTGKLKGGVGSIDNNIVGIALSGSSLALALNLDKCLDKAIHLGLRLRLPELCQAASYGQGHL